MSPWAGILAWLLIDGLAVGAAAPSTNLQPTLIVVVGAGGNPELGQNFGKWAGHWETAARQANAKMILLGLAETNAVPDKDQLKKLLDDEPKVSLAELWLVLIGHGTFDGQEAKFNLRGPDITAAELTAWLKPFQRPLALINTASSSGPFLNALSAPGRIVITATKSGYEQNYARFGQYLAEAMIDNHADLDQDGQTSLLEAFLTASRQVDEFYRVEGRLVTEHALLDDTGDGLGTPAEWFRGLRAVKKAKDNALLDGLRAHQIHLVRSAAEQQLSPEQRQRRDALEQDVAALREKKKQLSEDEYYRQLEPLFLELAHFYE